MRHMSETKPVRSFYDIDGWFRWLDKMIFDELLRAQSDSPPGDLVELGAYKGKSAVVIGDHLRADERFVVVDLFGTAKSDDGVVTTANQTENQISYAALTRNQFESNYLSLHPVLPEIIQALSSEVVQHVGPGSARFVHVDASHLYAQVREDVVNTRQLLRADGVVVFDDYRSEHTPGVAAAVWEAVIKENLIPFAITPNKLYGVYGDPEPYANALRKLFATDDRYWSEDQEVMGRTLLRARPAYQKQAPKPQSVMTKDDLNQLAEEIVRKLETSSFSGQSGKSRAYRRRDSLRTSGALPLESRRRGLRRLPHDILPPAVTRWIINRRRP